MANKAITTAQSSRLNIGLLSQIESIDDDTSMTLYKDNLSELREDRRISNGKEVFLKTSLNKLKAKIILSPIVIPLLLYLHRAP